MRRKELPAYARYLISILLILVASEFNTLFHTHISPTNLVMPYLLVVVISAVYLGRGPAILASFLSVLVFDYFFVPPYLTLAVSDTEYLLTFFGLLGVGLVISELTTRLRDQVEIAQRRAEDTAALYGLSRDLAIAVDMKDILAAIERNVSQFFNRSVAIFLPDPDRQGNLQNIMQREDFPVDEGERAAIEWVFKHGMPAGRGTDQFSAARARYLPIKTSRGIAGVLGASPQPGFAPLTPDQARLLEAFSSQASLAIERIQLGEEASRAQLLQATEKLQEALLNSISHDLRTPLVSITGALSSLRIDGDRLSRETRTCLIETAHDEAERLNHLVDNLLNMTRIEAKALQVSPEPNDVQDLVGIALEQIGNRLGEHPIQIQIPADLPMVPIDIVLMAQVLVNLLDNAIKYSPRESPIEVCASVEEDHLVMEVSDRGPGIPDEALPHIFDKFYRIQHPHHVSGTGLGLAICKGIIEAHSGQIEARNRPGGGSVFTIRVPLGKGELDE